VSETDLTTPVAVVQRLYRAFGEGDVATIVSLVGDDLDWTFAGDSAAPYNGRHGKADLPAWFGKVAQADAIESFEPREFLGAGDYVTVFGRERCVMRPGNGLCESDWVHVWTVRDGLVRRFWGTLDTEKAAAARRGAPA
jgi:ketosteroid isomerase-like protein